MKSIKKSVISILVAGVVTMTANASLPTGVGFGYTTEEPDDAWGTGKSETYDIAMLLNDAAAIGKKLVGARISVAKPEDVDYASSIGYEVWLSSELKLNGTSNVADIASVWGVAKDGYVDVTFDTPYVIPEGGVYVGYSMSDPDGATMPKFPVVASREKNVNGFFVHSSRTYLKWKDHTSDQNMTAGIMAIVEDPSFSDANVSVVELQNVNVRGGLDSNVIPMTIENKGRMEVQSIEYTYKIGDKEGTATLSLPTPLRNQYGQQALVKIPLPAISEGGVYDMILKIEKVNGKTNDSQNNVGSAKVNVMAFNPLRMAVLEEYTGTWCSFCPRGWLGLEMMYERYPDRFIGISYHANDVMQMRKGWPQVSNHYPDAWIDRTINTDAYAGNLSSNEFGVDLVWEEACLELSEASIYMTTEWQDETHLKVNSFTTFASDFSDEYRVEYVLLADDLHGEGSDWEQLNGFSGNDAWKDAPGMDQFVTAPSVLSGFRYNSVAVLTSGLKGVANSLPQIKANQTIEHSYVFNVDDAVNDRNEPLVQDREKLRVVAMVLKTDDSYGTICNAALCKAGESGNVDNILVSEETRLISSEYYDVNGRRVDNRHKGLLIRVERFADGSAKSAKLMNK